MKMVCVCKGSRTEASVGARLSCLITGFGCPSLSALAVTFLLCYIPVLAMQSKGYGPEVKSFLEYVRHEETELNFQIEHKEIGRRDYLRSKARLEILRETVLNRVKQTGQDLVPEYHIVAVDEVEELIPGGTEALKGVKPGEVLLSKWKYVGNAVRGEKFYVLERIAEN